MIIIINQLEGMIFEGSWSMIGRNFNIFSGRKKF